MTISRRALLGRMGGTAAALSLMGLPALAQERRIRHFWWGNPERDKRTFEVIELFKAANPGLDVSGETIGWADYWTKMATQTAGGNMADLVQMDYRYLFEYVRRGALLPLDEHIGKTLMIQDFDQGPLQGGMVDGKLYALNIGSNSQVVSYNKARADEYGLEFDPINWTYDDLIAAATKANEASGGKVKGIDDLSVQAVTFEAWCTQNGRDFYTAEGTVGATEDDIASYWQFWADMRKADLVPGAERTVRLQDPKMNEHGMVTGETVFSLIWSNQMVGAQALMQDPLYAAMIPHKPEGKPGQFIKPSMFMSLSRDAKDIDGAMAYMNAWVNDPKETAVLGLERGIPCSPAVRAALAPSFSDIEKRSVDFFEAIQTKVGPLPPPAPKGAGEVKDAFMRIGTDVTLGTYPPAEGAKLFMEEATSILERAL